MALPVASFRLVAVCMAACARPTAGAPPYVLAYTVRAPVDDVIAVQMAALSTALSRIRPPWKERIHAGTQEASVMVFRKVTGKPVEMTGFGGKVRALARSPSGDLLAASSSFAITLWSFQGRGPVGQVPDVLRGLRGRTTGLAFAGERRVISSSDDGVFRVHRRSGKWTLEAADDIGVPLLSLSLAPDGRRAFGSAKDGRLLCWELEP